MSTTTPIQNLQAIPVSAIAPNPNNPRKAFDQAALKELAESIKAHGVRQPILLRPNGGPGKYELVCGERRWRASKLAGKTEIPAIVDPTLTDRAALEIGILENLQRQDVHPLDEALGYQALLNAKADNTAPKHTVETIAGKVGKSASYVYQRLKLADLVPKAQDDFRTGFITAAHAIDIARLQPADQARALEFCHREEWGSKRTSAPPFRELRTWIQDNVQLNLDKAPFDIADAKLVPSAGACTNCPKRSGSNPMLFEGIGKNTCMDPTCYQAKKMALVNVNVDQLEAKYGEKPILISHEYSPERGKGSKGILYESQYRDHYHSNGKDHKIQANSCPDARLAVYVDNDYLGKGAGSTAWVCVNRKKCTVHADSYGSHNGENSAMARRNQRISRHYKTELFKAIAAALKKPTRADRELVATTFFDKLGHYQETPLIQALDWDPKLGQWNGKTALRKKFAEMSDAELERHLILMAIARDLESNGYGTKIDRGEVLEAVAKRHGVKCETFLEASKAKFAKKKPKLQTSAKKKA